MILSCLELLGNQFFRLLWITHDLVFQRPMAKLTRLTIAEMMRMVAVMAAMKATAKAVMKTTAMTMVATDTMMRAMVAMMILICMARKVTKLDALTWVSDYQI